MMWHGRAFAFSRHDLPEVFISRPSTVEGAGNAGCALHPRSRVQNAQRKAHTSIQVQRRQSGIPCAMVLRLMPCSPRRRIRLVTVAAGLMADRSGWIKFATDSLAPATGVGTTRFCRTRIAPFVLRAAARSRETALRTHLRADAAASTASHPAFVTIAIRPSCRDGTGRAGRTDLPDGESGISFAGELDRANQPEIIAENRAMAHRLRGRPIPVHSFGEPCWIFGRSIHQFWRGTA